MDRRQPAPLTWSDVTPRAAFIDRRRALAAGAAALAAGMLGAEAARAEMSVRPSPFSIDEEPNSFQDFTTYNNFYEFGTGKSDPQRHAHRLTTEPWSVMIDGLVAQPREWPIEEILEGTALEERIYRLRCVEAWSMVVPWVGFELGALLDRVGVLPEARYVAFETLYRPEEMPGQRTRILDWPYREGLRLDEARHPLTIMAVGAYREPLLNQNGAPIRLVVPWKYGFKSIKSVVRITLTAEEPPTSWNVSAPQEYGFYANVNPAVDHPRWSQASERRVGAGLFAARIPTLMFNGYADEVAHLYEGMDLTRLY